MNDLQLTAKQVIQKHGIDENSYQVLADSIYPDATPQAISMVLAYCKARRLDPLKKPVHIVPMRTRNPQTGNYETRDVVIPGLNECLITAHRTGEFRGMSDFEYGPDIDFMGKKVHEWIEVKAIREINGGKVTFSSGRIYFEERAKTKLDSKTGVTELQAEWRNQPRYMHQKAAEMTALRRAFPESGETVTQTGAHDELRHAHIAKHVSYLESLGADKKMIAEYFNIGHVLELDGDQLAGLETICDKLSSGDHDILFYFPQLKPQDKNNDLPGRINAMVDFFADYDVSEELLAIHFNLGSIQEITEDELRVLQNVARQLRDGAKPSQFFAYAKEKLEAVKNVIKETQPAIGELLEKNDLGADIADEINEETEAKKAKRRGRPKKKMNEQTDQEFVDAMEKEEKKR